MKQQGRIAGGLGALIASTQTLLREKAVLSGTGALLKVNQPDGFDCPGCAWPEGEGGEKRHLDFCENGLKAVAAETTSKRVDPAFFEKHTVTELLGKSDFWLEQQGRLTHPMIYRAETDKYAPIGWEEAFATIGTALRGLGHPDRAAFYTSGRTSNEAAFLFQLFAREFGTNNLPDCSNMCHESSGVALVESIGIGKGTVTLADFDASDCIFILGQNPGTNHPRMLATLQQARKRGAHIVVVNPLREAGLMRFIHPKDPLAMLSNAPTPIATHYLTPLVGGDLAVLKGLCKCVLEAEAANPGRVLDREFIDAHTNGFDAFAEAIRRETWEDIEREGGVSRLEIEEIADLYCRSERVIACWAMGLTQHRKAVATIQHVVDFLLLRGNLGRPGAGACPVRGHSNVQGDRTMGITERPSEEFLDRLGRAFGFSPPRGHGADVVRALQSMAAGEVRALVAMGGNFAVATPDRDFTERALRSCELTAHVSTKLNRSHLVTGRLALILPCLGRSELDPGPGSKGNQFVTVEDSMSMVHASHGHRPPASPHLLSEPAIVAGLALAALPETRVPWKALAADYGRIREKIAEVVPGFEDFNRKIEAPGGFYLGNSAGRREWRTGSGKARFVHEPLDRIVLKADELRLMTIRSHDQYNTTLYGLDDRYRGIKGERRVVFMNARDIQARGLAEGEIVDLVGEDGKASVRVAPAFKVTAYDIPAGCAAAYFPETNVLVPVDSVAEKSNTPTSKFIPITVRRAGARQPSREGA
jgi:molybdopterin-dependent oxidoreductase alpha subunit